ncbi:MAG: hypothetical protein IIW42_02665, partial [Bacteroidaceae bacterium]|nr:hypothetical protein [Bacteroidaceae bacterium]
FCADYLTVGQLSHFAPHGFSWDTSRILRFISHGETPVAICAAYPTMKHQSHFAPTVFSWNTSRTLRRMSHGETPVANCADYYLVRFDYMQMIS